MSSGISWSQECFVHGTFLLIAACKSNTIMYPELSLWGDILCGMKQLVKFRCWNRKWFSLVKQTFNLFGHVLSEKSAVANSRYFNPSHETRRCHNKELQDGVLTCLWSQNNKKSDIYNGAWVDKKVLLWGLTLDDLWNILIIKHSLGFVVAPQLLFSFDCMNTYSWRDWNITAHRAQALQ